MKIATPRTNEENKMWKFFKKHKKHLGVQTPKLFDETF